jgi:pectate lyase
MAPLSKKLISDSNGRSRLKLFEDGRELPYPHSSHDDIRELGAGRYSHWGNAVYFSSSDNSDPGKNGRRYSVREV